MSQITVENISKTFRIKKKKQGVFGEIRNFFYPEYREVKALDRVSFSIEQGELIGYIGPNGAGKSTTIKILSGILVPDEGKCLINGLNPWKNRIEHVKKIGVVFGQKTQLWWDLPVYESFSLIKDIYRISENEFQSSKSRLTEILKLQDFLDVPVRQLSLGQRMRCDLAASLLHNPDILFLDEPTIGLDASSKLAIRDFIKKINQEKKVTVILTTHDMDDIEALCNRLLIIGQGKIIMDGTVQDLRNRIRSERLLIADIRSPFEFDGSQQKGVYKIAQSNDRVTIYFDPKVLTAQNLINSVMEKNRVQDFYIENPSIERIIAELYGEMEQYPYQ